MGKRGPAPAPTALKLVRGTRKDRINENTPVPQARQVTCPMWLSSDAKAVWKRLAPQLRARRLLTDWDREAFAAFCEAVVHHRKACDLVERGGILIKGYRGQLVKNPALQIVRDSAQAIRVFAQEFGLTPSARSSIDAGTWNEEAWDLD